MPLPTTPDPQRHTMQRLEELRRTSKDGGEYWMAREIFPVLGYGTWSSFENVVERAKASMSANRLDPSHQIVQTTKMMGRGGGAQVGGIDFFLSRAACYLIAMNGEPSKPEIAAAQAYFAIQAHRMEQQDALSEDEKRIALRDKVTGSMKRVSSVAQAAGVSNKRQPVFHDQRYRGLYGASSAQVKIAKGLQADENLFDRVGPLELSTHDFQMNLAADIIQKENISGEEAAINKNLEVARKVRETIAKTGGTLPENLPLTEHIGDVRKRVTGQRTKAVIKRPK